MIFLRSLCLLALTWYSINCTMDTIPKIEFRGTVTEFKEHFGDCEFAKNIDSVANFEDHLFELAFEKGNLPVARWFIQHGCNMHKLYKKECKNYRDTDRPPLIAAVENGHLPVVNLLLAMGASPDGVRCPNTMGCKHQRGPAYDFLCKNMQALPLAFYNGHIAIAQALIAAGSERYRDGEVKSVINGGHSELIEFFGMKISDWNCVRSAVLQNNPRLVQVVLKNLTEHLKKYMPSEDYYGFNYATLVVESILNDNPEITHLLLDAQPTFDVNFVSWSFRGPNTRPIIAAIQKGNLALIQDLIKRGVWINPILTDHLIKYDSIELNPLYAAADADNIKAVELLLQERANPMHLACYPGVLGCGSSSALPVIEFIRQFQGWETYPGCRKRPNLNRIIHLLEEHIGRQKP